MNSYRKKVLARFGYRPGSELHKTKSVFNRANQISLLLVAVCSLISGCKSSSFYPIGIYTSGHSDELRVVKDAGFNLVSGTPGHEYLQRARDLNLKVLATPGSSAGTNFDRLAAGKLLREFDGHPALWAWYIIDEPDYNAVSPALVQEAFQTVDRYATKPAALVLQDGWAALHYSSFTDILMLDRYPVGWTPVCSFLQHLKLARLSAPGKPLIAVVQAFNWGAFSEVAPRGFRDIEPSYDELRCMTYSSLIAGANGIFYYALSATGWELQSHPKLWGSVKSVVQEVNERLPLFKAERQWWIWDIQTESASQLLNECVEPSVAAVYLRVRKGNEQVRSGFYAVLLNTTPDFIDATFTMPNTVEPSAPVFGENRAIPLRGSLAADSFAPYQAHVYGPLASARL